MYQKDFINWLIGFIEGEGCFTFEYNTTTKQHKSGYWIHALFQIGLSPKDEAILHKIKRELNMGVIYHRKQRSSKNEIREMVDFRIAKLSEIKRLINLLDKYELYTTKKQDYELWKKGVKIINEKKHLTPNGLTELLGIREKMNIRRGQKRKKN